MLRLTQEGTRLKEAGSINKSLLTLSRVIAGLSANNQAADGAGAGGRVTRRRAAAENFINFRDSKLTRILQPSLAGAHRLLISNLFYHILCSRVNHLAGAAGNTRTVIVTCVTPADRFLEETRGSLMFAARAKMISTRVEKNEIMDDQVLAYRGRAFLHCIR